MTLTRWKDKFEILRDDIIFLLTFLNDPPSENIEETICSQLCALCWEDFYGLLPFDDDGEMDFINKKELMNDFMMNMQSVNATIRQIYGNFPESSLYNFPKVVSPLFLDFLIQTLGNLKERLISDLNYAPFAKYKIIKIEQELVDLRPLFNHFFNLQSEIEQTWFEVVDSLHQIDHVICLSISSWFVFDHPIWYYMAHLSIALDEIIVVKTELENIKENTMYNARCIPRSTGLTRTHMDQAKPSEINEIVVGFDEEANKIIENITRGSMSLEIVSIVGMGGLGKTTLAKKVYGSSSVKSSFVVFSFSYVSQDPNTRTLLLDILGDVKGVYDRINDMTEDDLAHELWKCLSGQKYLVILDDIWTEGAWNKIRSSFPDDKNGSRVVFTTRSLEVADKCKISYNQHQLRFLSEVESWELLQKKVFSEGKSPPDLSEIGKLIAKNCKGLPLAIVVIAGLLVTTEKDLRWWSEVAERVDFPGKLESLTFRFLARKSRYMINFPSTVKKLTLDTCQLPSAAILVIAELQFLEVLKLRRISFPEARLETEDLVFQNLIFFEMYNVELEEWTASTDSFPWIEQLVITWTDLTELPSCFGEISTLKRVDVRFSPGVEDSALKIQEEQRGYGNEVEVFLF